MAFIKTVSILSSIPSYYLSSHPGISASSVLRAFSPRKISRNTSAAFIWAINIAVLTVRAISIGAPSSIDISGMCITSTLIQSPELTPTLKREVYGLWRHGSAEFFIGSLFHLREYHYFIHSLVSRRLVMSSSSSKHSVSCCAVYFQSLFTVLRTVKPRYCATAFNIVLLRAYKIYS